MKNKMVIIWFVNLALTFALMAYIGIQCGMNTVAAGIMAMFFGAVISTFIFESVLRPLLKKGRIKK